MTLGVLTVLAVMGLTAVLTLAVHDSLKRPQATARFDEALAAMTGSDIQEVDTALMKGDAQARAPWNWNSFWYVNVVRTGRTVEDEGTPGRVAMAVAVVLWFFGFAVSPGGINGGNMAAACGVGGLYLWLGVEQGRRRVALEKQLPMLLSSLRAQLTAGQSVQSGIMQLADDMPAPLGDELRQVKADVSVSVPLDEALGSLAVRLKSRVMLFLVSSIGIALRSGSDLGPQLITIEEIVRQRARIDGKIRSALALARPTAYLGLGMPIVMGIWMFISDPTFSAYFFGDGILMLLGVVVLYVLGALVMRQLIKNVEKI